MSSNKTQYQHYIPRFILRKFAFAEQNPIRWRSTHAGKRPSTYLPSRAHWKDGLLHVCDLPSEQFRLGYVGKTCGAQNLYYDQHDADHMRIEHLFSELECKTAAVFQEIQDAVAGGRDSVDILERDVRTLFKFMNVSLRRSEQYRDEVMNPRRENDFMHQRLFEASKKRGGSGESDRCWLEDLLYLLETSHKDMLSHAETPEEYHAAFTYRYFTENYAMQVWKAAEGFEFFLNDRLVDFEGDTQSTMGVEMAETGPRLIWMTTEDPNHLVLPISPEVALVFCDESRCWVSPFAETMHAAKIPYPENSLLGDAPHKDMIDVHVPGVKRSQKSYPPTTAWRVSIGALSRDHHRIIAAYSLGHAKSFVVVRDRGRFERAKRHLEVFTKERLESWERQGFRSDCEDGQRQNKGAGPVASSSSETAALHEILVGLEAGPNFEPTTKDMKLECWVMVRAMLASLPRPGEGEAASDLCVMYPALREAFEAAYGPKNPQHRDLVTIGFPEFFRSGFGEDMFARLFGMIERRIAELMSTEAFPSGGRFEEMRKDYMPCLAPLPSRDPDDAEGKKPSLSPSHRSILRAAQSFDTLRWMFEERQDILATFVQQLAVPIEDTQPRLVRIRGRRL